MQIKERVVRLERKLKEAVLARAEVQRLTRDIEALVEYLCADTLKREVKERPADFPLNPTTGKRASSKISKEAKTNAIKAQLTKLGCTLKEKKTNTQIFLKKKKLGVLKKSGRIERKITIDGATGYRKVDTDKFLEIVRKKAKK